MLEAVLVIEQVMVLQEETPPHRPSRIALWSGAGPERVLKHFRESYSTSTLLAHRPLERCMGIVRRSGLSLAHRPQERRGPWWLRVLVGG